MSDVVHGAIVSTELQHVDYGFFNIKYVSVCDDGMYIENKTWVHCQGHCKNWTPCNRLTWRCDKGCENHWTGEFCQRRYIIYNYAYHAIESY